MMRLHRIGTLVTRRLVLFMTVLFALTMLVVPAHAGTEVNMWAPFEVLTLNACTGEVVLITGKTHLVGHLVDDGSGSRHIQATVSIKGTGVGEAGTPYTLTGIGLVRANNADDTGNGAQAGTAILTARLISKGSTTNSTDRMLTHLTITANGELTVAVLREESKCVG
jgi:hypothetical protein